MKPPRRMFLLAYVNFTFYSLRMQPLTIYRGKSAVRSQPALIELAEMFVLRKVDEKPMSLTSKHEANIP